MSSHNPNEKLEPRKSKVSVALAINHGLGGPKAMVKTAADGKQVNIPALPYVFDTVTKNIRRRALLVLHSLLRVCAARCKRRSREGGVLTSSTALKSLPRKAVKS